MRGNWLDDDSVTPAISGRARPRPATPADTPARGRSRLGHDRTARPSSAHTLDAFDPDNRFSPAPTEVDAVTARTNASDSGVRTPGWALAVTAAGVIAALSVLAGGFAFSNGETITAGFVMIVLGTVTLLALKRVAADTMHGEYPILVAGLAMKLLASLLRYWISFSGTIYERSDAKTYDVEGRRIATEFISQGHLPNYKSYTGSNFLRLLTGILYDLIPPSTLAAFFIFGWFSFLGYLMFWRAMRRTVAPGQDRKYLILLLFMPSVAYWPSSLGKEAVVILGLGMASLGFARMITNATLSGAVLAGAGTVLVTYVRPHVALVILIGAAVAMVVRKRPSGQIVSSIVTAVLFIPILTFTLGQASAYFNGDITDSKVQAETQTEADDRTSQGGSQFDNAAVQITNPINFPYATWTVIMRPMPWEAPSPQEFATAIESTFIGLLLIRNFPRIARNLRRVNGYMIYAFVNLVVFIFLFSNFANFGILARQRTQIAPFLFLLLAMPLSERIRKKQRNSDFAAA